MEKNELERKRTPRDETEAAERAEKKTANCAAWRSYKLGHIA